MLKKLVTTTALVAAVTAGALTLGTQAKADDITIAVAGPMTGDLAAFGEQLRRGSEMAVKDINAKGGVLGKQVKLEVGDDQCDPKQAVQVANDLVKKGAVFIAGHFCSGSSIPASDVYAEEGIVQMTPASTNPAFTEGPAAKGTKTIFRTCGRDDAQGKFAGPWLAKTYGGKNIAVLDDKSAYGQGLANETQKGLEGAGGKVALRDTYTQKEKDFSALISKMKDAKVDVVYIGGYHTEAGLILRQMRDQNLKAQLISGDALVTNEYWSITGPAGEGTMMTFGPDPRNKPTAVDVVKQFKAKNIDPEGYTLYTYAALQIWAAAANKAGTTDARKVAETMRSGAWDTVIGKLSFDTKGDITVIDYVMYRWDKDGKYGEVGANKGT